MIPDNVHVVERFALHVDVDVDRDPGKPFGELALIPFMRPVA